MKSCELINRCVGSLPYARRCHSSLVSPMKVPSALLRGLHPFSREYARLLSEAEVFGEVLISPNIPRPNVGHASSFCATERGSVFGFGAVP